ncbi:Aminoglycoside phosphotransferase [Penicillium herquei]|nr:Aminoglycoside phosphotransferase [Penicillium herquei]
MPEELMTQDEAASKLLAFMFSGALGPSKGKGVGYALIEATSSMFSWSAALEDLDRPDTPIDRYLIKVDRRSRLILPPELIIIPEPELAEAFLSATGQHLASSTRFTDGALSISYKVNAQETPDVAYVVQLRHHGNVASMD